MNDELRFKRLFSTIACFGIVSAFAMSFTVAAKGDGDPKPIILNVDDEPDKLDQEIFLASPLYRKVTLNFENTSLVEVLETLCKSVAVKLELDEDRLISAGYSIDMPITIKSKRIFLEDALTQVLNPFERLSFTVDGDKIFVSTLQRVRARANARANDMRQPVAGNQSKPGKTGRPSEGLAGLELTVHQQLERPFNDSIDDIPASEVLADIAKKVGLKLEFDHAGIWAGGGNDGMLSINVRLMDVCESFKGRAELLNLPVWFHQVLKRGDGTIRVSEALIAILEPLALDSHIAGEVLLISSYQQIALLKNSKVLDPHDGAQPSVGGLRTRVVTHWRHQVGKPIDLKVELRNFSKSIRYFDSQSTLLETSIHLIGPDGKQIGFRGDSVKAAGKRVSIQPGETIVLFKTNDLKQAFDLAIIGKYTIQFRVNPTEEDVDAHPPGEPELSPLTNSVPIIIEIYDKAGE
jgi:hypothetical protein